jgi:hypothetical protein
MVAGRWSEPERENDKAMAYEETQPASFRRLSGTELRDGTALKVDACAGESCMMGRLPACRLFSGIRTFLQLFPKTSLPSP